MTTRDFALLAQESYTAAPDIGVADSASRAIVRQTAAGLCVVFRGSDDIASWIHDLDALTTNVPGVGDVHEGFWTAWQAIAAPVTAAIGNQPVTFVGHSLGAAMAILAAVSATLAGKPPLAVYAFEPPRVSPGLGVRTLLAGVPLHLFRNGGDPVTNLPWFWNQPALLTHIGPSRLLDDVEDHDMANVIANLGNP